MSQLHPTLNAYFASLGAHDADTFVGLHSAEAVFHDPIAPEPFRGHAALRAFFEQVGGLSETLEVIDVALLFSGPTTFAVQWTASATLAGSKKAVRWPCVTNFQLDGDGRICAALAVWDHEAAMRDVMPS